MPSDRILSSPNRTVCELFEALRRLCMRASEAYALQDESTSRQDAAVCVILSVQCVEVFFNVYFRVLISEPAYAHAAQAVSDNLRTRCGLDQKIKNWPKLVFGKKLALDNGAGKEFVTLKNLRNQLMHFTSSHDTFSIPGVTIHGLADTSVYETITATSAVDALRTAEEFLCEVFKLRGLDSSDLPHALHSWTGKLPV